MKPQTLVTGLCSYSIFDYYKNERECYQAPLVDACASFLFKCIKDGETIIKLAPYAPGHFFWVA